MSILTKKAVLASLNIGGWEPRKRDEKASSLVHSHFNAEKDSGNYNKCLFDVKDDAWVRITKARSALRDYHYAHTLPWIHKGAQLLTSASYLDYNSNVIKLCREYTDAANDFIRNHYERLKTQAKKKRNGLYNEADYPSASDLGRKFYAEVNFFPVPDSGHVIVDLQNSEVERIKRDTEAMVEAAVQKAQAAVWERLYEPVKNMAAALADPERRFHDTLVGNVREIVEIAPSMNLTGDKRLNEMIAEVKKHLTKTKPDTLRDDKDVRAENARKAAELARKMASLMPKAPS